MESVRDKVVIITGASSGIGAATAVLFAKYGAKLVLTGRNTVNLNQVTQECCNWGLDKEKILVVSADVKNREDINWIVAETIKKFNRIDVLVNNAGIFKYGLLESVSVDDIEEMFLVNVTAPVLLTKLCIPHIKQSKGSIINVSSIGGLHPYANEGVYCMTKAALDMFTSTLTLELGSFGIRVNSVCPGLIRTPIHNVPGTSAKETNERLEKTAKVYPAGRVGLPEEVANSIVFLASDAAQFINGVKLPVDGGAIQTSTWYEEEQKTVAATSAQ